MLFGGNRKSDSKTSEIDAQKGADSSSLHMQEEDESSSESAELSLPFEEEKKEGSPGKQRSSWRWKNRKENNNKPESESEDSSALHDDPFSALTNDDPSSVQTTSVSPVCEVLPDHESDWHLHIQNHDWDELENLLRDYNYKLYMKKPQKPKKKPRQLRVTKYMPEIPEMPWNKEKEVPISPLLGLDPLGRTPLHLGLSQNLPNRLLLRLLFIARDAASVADMSGSMPLHIACAHERRTEVVDKLIRGYPQASWQPDGRGRTPLMWAVEMARLKQLDTNLPVHNTYWGFPSRLKEQEWQVAQEKIWETVHFLLENRESRRKKLVPQEHRLVVQSFGTAAPPKIVKLFVSTGGAMMAKENVAGPSLSLCISRQYPLPILKDVLEKIPTGFAKMYKDSTGRGVVALHYRLGCTVHNDTGGKRSSFRMIMQHCANAKLELSEPYDPPAHYLEWFDKLKLLINQWGSHFDEEDEEIMDELLLHNALSNPDVPPSLVQLLSALFPNATDLEHPKSSALPIHLACRAWRYRTFPQRRGEKEMPLDKVVSQLLVGDPKRTRKRYKGRLPLHHAIAADRTWAFLKPLVTSDRKTLRIRDPSTKLYPFQLAAGRIEMSWDREAVTSIQFTPSQWKAMRDYERDHEIRKVVHAYALEQLTAIFELLRHDPDVIDTKTLFRVEEERKSKSQVKRPLSVQTFAASEDVSNLMLTKAVRVSYEIGNVSAHFITWSYDKKRIGWKTHRSNLATIKEAIMDGFVPILLDKWWRKLKIWIWHDCTWDNIPRRDEFLLHAALSNPDTPVWVANLIIECFPRSASIPIPRSGGKFPLHIACETDKYVHLPFEFKHSRTVIDLTLHAYPDAVLMKWDDQLPIHLAINAGKEWSDLKALAEEEPASLAVPDPKFDLFAYQQMALHRPYNKSERSRFEKIAINQVGRSDWKKCSSHEKVRHLSTVLEDHEKGVLTSIWQLLKSNTTLLSLGIVDDPTVTYSSGSQDECYRYYENLSDGDGPSNSKWLKNIQSNLSVASLDFLGEVYEADKLDSSATIGYPEITTKSSGGTAFSDSSSLGQSFDSGSLGSLNTREIVELRSEAKAPDEKDAGDNFHSLRTIRTGSNQRRSELDSEVVIEKFDASDSEHEHEKLLDSEFEYEEEDPNFASDEEHVSMGDSIRNISTPNVVGKSDERTCISIDRLSTIIEGESSKQQTESTLPSRASKQILVAKHLLVVTESEAFVVWKTDVFSPSSFQNLSRTEPWIAELRGMGEGVDVKELHTFRHKKEQKAVASTIVERKAIVVDEDEDFIWVLCGRGAASSVENYDIESAMAATEALEDSKTALWLDDFKETDTDNDLSASRLRNTDQDEVLNWLWSILTNRGVQQSASKTKEFDLTRTKLRDALSRRNFEGISEEANAVFFDYSRRKLSYELSKNKLIFRLKSRRRVPVQYKTARAHRFTVARHNLNQAFSKIEFFKKLYKKQRKAIRQMKKESAERKSAPEQAQLLTNLSVDAEEKKESNASCPPPHLTNVNQPSEVDDDGDSLGSTDLFDPPTGPPPKKPLLAAALKAKHAREQAGVSTPQAPDTATSSWKKLSKASEDEEKKLHGSAVHLMNLKQPSEVDDDGSLGSTEWFDPPTGSPMKKPLLAAAPKAKHAREQDVEPDPHTSGDIAAELQPKKVSDKHVRQVHQPFKGASDGGSLVFYDMLDPPGSPSPKKPLPAVAMQSKHQQDTAKSKQDESLAQETQVSKKQTRITKQSITLPASFEASMMLDDVFNPTSSITQQTDKTSYISSSQARTTHPQQVASPLASSSPSASKKYTEAVSYVQPMHENGGSRVVSSSKPRPSAYEVSMSFDDVFKPATSRAGNVHKYTGARASAPASQDAKKPSKELTSHKQKNATSFDASMNIDDVFKPATSRAGNAHTHAGARASAPASQDAKKLSKELTSSQQKNASSFDASMNIDDVFKPATSRAGHVHKYPGARASAPASQDAKKLPKELTSSQQKNASSFDASMSIDDVFTPASSRIATPSSKVPEEKSRSSAHTVSSTRTSQSERIKAETPKGDCKETTLKTSSDSLDFDDVFRPPAKSQSIPSADVNTATERNKQTSKTRKALKVEPESSSRQSGNKASSQEKDGGKPTRKVPLLSRMMGRKSK